MTINYNDSREHGKHTQNCEKHYVLLNKKLIEITLNWRKYNEIQNVGYNIYNEYYLSIFNYSIDTISVVFLLIVRIILNKVSTSLCTIICNYK